MLHEPGFGLVALAFTFTATLVARATVFAQTVVPTDATGIANTGIAAASVGALIWITKMVASGKLVARDPSDAEKALTLMAEHMLEMNKKLVSMAEELVLEIRAGKEHENRYLTLLEARLGEQRDHVAT